MMGMGFYGRSFTLQSPTDNSLGALSIGPGLAQPQTKTDGLMAYFEVCTLVEGGWKREWSPEGRAPYAFSGTQWVSYDDMESISVKANYIRSKGLGGAMVWTVDMDDYSNVCGDGPYPLMNKLKEVLTSPYIPQLPNQRPDTTSTPRFSSLSTSSTSTLPTTASPPLSQTREGQTEERLYGATCGPPSVCPHGRYIPDVCNASVYYQCNFRIALTRVCPLGLVWNTVSQACDWHRADHLVTLKVKTQVISTTEHKKGINVIPTFRTTVFIPRSDTTTPTPKTTIVTKPRVHKDEDILPTFRTTVFIPEAMLDTAQPGQQSNDQDDKPRGIPTPTAHQPGRQATTNNDCKPTSCPAGLLIADPCDQRCYYSCAENDLAHHSCCPAPTVWNERIVNCDWSWSR
ncbi:chitotriosidase-1-like [Argopecten irradians]|uniref:chitotriosidase-1-like n=1 Tax=Argopecten irradians TaxID=31199 RepID=UPI003718723C